jgi:hypothetical protein
MTNEQFNTGDTVKLTIDGVDRIYEIKLIVDNEYLLFNKYVISVWRSAEYIINNLSK